MLTIENAAEQMESSVLQGQPEGMSPDFLKAISSTQAMGAGMTAAYYGDPLAAASATGLHPLIRQDLDPVIWALTERAPYHTPFLNKLRTKEAKSLLEEYDQLTGLGDKRSFFAEGGLPREATSTYERRLARVKFMGQTGIVTGPAAAAIGHSMFGAAKAREMFARTQRLLLDTEEGLFFGSSDLSTYAFDGIIHQILEYAYEKSLRSTLVVDLRGQPLDVGYIDRAIMSVWNESNGVIDGIWTSAADKMFIDAQQQQYRRVTTGGDTVDVTRNVIATKTHTPFGDADHWFSKFLTAPLGPSSAVRGTYAPVSGTVLSAQPTAAAATLANTDTGGTSTQRSLAGWPFRQGTAGSGLPADTYYYWVAPVNAYGEGVATAVGTTPGTALGYAATAGQMITLTITATSEATAPADSLGGALARVTSYKIYRGTTATMADAKFLVEYPKPATADTSVVVYDDGTWIPGTTMAVLTRSEALSLRYLLRPTTYDLAKIDDRERWMHIQYLTMIAHAPVHNRLIMNIGEPPAVGTL